MMQSEDPFNRKDADNIKFWWGLSFCVLIAILLRSIKLIQRSFSCDEVYELRHLSLNIFEIANDKDGFPPLFRWLLSLFISIAGESFARLPSVAFGVGTVVVVALLARLIAGNQVAFNAALFSAISSHQIEFSQMGRAYSCYMFWVGLSTVAAWRLCRKESRLNWLFYVVSCFFALGSHYFSVFFLAIIWPMLFLDKSRKQYASFLVAAVAFAAISVPWLWCLRIDLSEPVPAEWINKFDLKSLGYLYLTLIQGWTIGPSQIELLELPTKQGIVAILPWALVGFGCAAVLMWNGIQRIGFRSLGWFVLMLAATPITAGCVSTMFGNSFSSRYVAWLAVPLAILFASGMRWKGKSLSVIATYGLVVLNVLSVWNRSFEERYDRENYKELARNISLHEGKPAVIVLSHYLGPAVQRELPGDMRFCCIAFESYQGDDWQSELTAFSKEIKTDERVFLVVDWLRDTDVLVEKRNRLLSRIGGIRLKRVSNTIELYEGSGAKLKKWVDAWNEP